jgi:hypothetical protein
MISGEFIAHTFLLVLRFFPYPNHPVMSSSNGDPGKAADRRVIVPV